MTGTFVLVTCEYPPFPGGIGTYSGELARAVAGAGAHVVVVGPAYTGDPPPDVPGVDYHPLLGHHSIPPLALPRLLGLLRRLPHDAIVLAADIRTVLLLYLLRPLHRRAYRVMLHGSEASKFRSGSAMFALARRAYLSAEVVIYNSRATREIFRAHIGTPAHEAVAYLGVDPDWYVPVSGTFEHAELAALPADATILCSVGRMEPRKGQLETVQAIAKARDVHGLSNPVYVIAGRAEDDRYASAVAEEGRRLGIRTILTGRLSKSDIKRLYASAAAHLLFARELPGKIEGFGLVLLEAAAQGCPSIAAAVGGIPEVLADTGTLVGDGDVDALAKAIAEYAGDQSLRSMRGEAAMARARHFSWRNCAALTAPEFASPDPFHAIAPEMVATPATVSSKVER